LRICVSAGEPLPKPTWEAWYEKTGIKILDGIGSTEMLHIFIGAPADKVRPGATGLPVPGYEARVLDEAGRDVAPGQAGRLAVRGPTGCRYLADERQTTYVVDGWNLTGDTYVKDEDGYYWFQARGDDMIISSGYNIAGPEVEEALLSHPAVAECGVVGAPDEERGQIVTAYVVLKPGHPGDAAMSKALDDHVKSEIAPYKHPRSIIYVDALPRTQTGKLQRYVLRQWAEAPNHIKASGGGPVSDHRVLQPPGWPRPRGYANGVKARGSVIVTAGQVGWNERGEFADGLVAQVSQTLVNVASVLAAGGAGPEHLVRLTWYVTDVAEYRASQAEIGRAYRGHRPALSRHGSGRSQRLWSSPRPWSRSRPWRGSRLSGH
jgi:enamine deaminase RidA (YjgF/YER057c/UK114 family)